MAIKTVNNPGRGQSTKNAICIGLGLVLLAVLFRAFGNTPSGAAASPPVNQQSSALTAAADRQNPAGARAITVHIPDALPRDLFDASAAFPPEAPPVVSSVAAATAKSQSVADEHAAIAAEARNTIILDATMLGADPTALINGRQCRVGNVVKGFTVKRIAADHVVIERDGVRLRVSYAKPGNARD